MKRIIASLSLSVALLVGISNATPAGTHRGKVVNLYTNVLNGNIAFNVINLDGTTSTTQVQFWVPASSTGAKNVLSTLLAAWQNGTTITFSSTAWTGGLDQISDMWITQ
jgi:hypothetical protein